VLSKVMAQRSDLVFSVSATTRQPRPGELDGVNYYFITTEKFKEMIAQGKFLEYNEHNATFYGTPREQLEEKLERGNVILDIEPNGAFNVRSAWADAVLIFILPPSWEELERRLRGRGDTSEEQMRLRLDRAKWEIEQSRKYDYVVTNEQVDTCAEEIINIIAKYADEE